MRRHLVAAVVLTAILSTPIAAQPAPPWMNSALSPDARADLVLDQMTQAEELQLVKGYFGAIVNLAFIKPAPPELRSELRGTAGFVPGIARLGVPSLYESDAGVGVANSGHMRPGDQATALPSGLAQAATWNPQLAYELGAVIGREARDRTFNVVLGGALNLARDPRGGRTFEYAGEDPLLAGSVVGEAIRGTESQHVISTTKHFALNDQETGRSVLSARIDEAAMRESDLLAFEIAIEHGNPGAVMCAYNRVNGAYSCENNFLLNQVLKRDWKYPGWVLSDWGAVHSTVASANAGLDQESASGFDRSEYFGAPLASAIKSGTVPPSRLRDMVHRILRSMFANGLFDDPATKRASDLAASHAVAVRGAEQSMVLLKNSNGTLPLSARAKSIAVIGAHADIGMLTGGGSSQVTPVGDDPAKEFMVGGSVWVLPNGARISPQGRHVFAPPSPFAAIRARAIRARAPKARVRYDEGTDIASAVKLAHESDIAIVFVYQWMTENEDVSNLSLPGAQDALVSAVAAANPRTIVVLETGGPVLMPWLDQVPAVLETWFAGNGGSDALARVLFGDADPGGRLPITFPASESQLPRPTLPGRGVSGFFDVDYSEGADVGYRWFERQKLSPLFAFGFGLSYTQFQFDGVQAATDGNVSLSVDVTNIGAHKGMETVELYATPPSQNGQSVPRLVGFQKVELSAGEKRRLTIAAEPRLLAKFDADAGHWQIAEGDYKFTVAKSSDDPGLQVSVHLPEKEIDP